MAVGVRRTVVAYVGEYDHVRDLESHKPNELAFADGTWVITTVDGQIFVSTDGAMSWEFLAYKAAIGKTLNDVDFIAPRRHRLARRTSEGSDFRAQALRR